MAGGGGAMGIDEDEIMKAPEASSVDIRIAMIGNVDRLASLYWYICIMIKRIWKYSVV